MLSHHNLALGGLLCSCILKLILAGPQIDHIRSLKQTGKHIKLRDKPFNGKKNILKLSDVKLLQSYLEHIFSIRILF